MIHTVYRYSGMGTTPASIDRHTGVMYENVPVMSKLDPDVQDFIRYHEEGHYVLQTTNEFLADKYALEKYIQQEKPLSESVKAFTRGITFSNPEHYSRLREHLKNVFKYDFQHNGNQKAANIMNINNNYGPQLSNMDGGELINSGLQAGLDFIPGGSLIGNIIDQVGVEKLLSGIFKGKNNSQWSKMAREDKIDFVNKGIVAAYENSDPQNTPESIFKALVAKVETEDSFDTWRDKNTDIYNTALLNTYYEKYKQYFTSPGKAKTNTQNQKEEAKPASPLMKKLGAENAKQGTWYYIAAGLAIVAVSMFVVALIRRKH